MKLTTTLILSLLVQGVWASDIERERRWADEIGQGLMDGTALRLKADGGEFLALHTAAAGAPRGAVVLIHGKGIHPDWPQVIAPLRSALPEAGWTVLSIQMPILGNEAQYDDYAPLYPEANVRIAAAVAYLRAQGTRRIALIGHSLGAGMAAHFLRKQAANHQVAGLVAIGMLRTGPAKDDQRLPKGVPVLDVYGAEDFPDVMTGLRARQREAQATGRRDYQPRMIAGADHFFEGQEQVLIKDITHWLGLLTEPSR